MDSETASAMTGSLFGFLFDVEDGWAHYEANYANEEGECNKANFDKLVDISFGKFNPKIKKILTKVVSSVYKKAGGSNEEQIEKTVNRVIKKIPSYLPFITNAVFRFFDADGSGSISKDEIIMAFGGLFGNPTAPGKPNPALLVPAIFRTLDEDNSGSIEPLEVQPFVNEIVSSVCKLILALLEELEEDFKGGMKKKVLKKAQAMIDGMTEQGMPFPLPVNDLAEMVASTIDAEYYESTVQPQLEMMRAIPEVVFQPWEAFFKRFEETCGGKAMAIKDTAALMAATFLPPLSTVLNPELVGAMLPGLLANAELPIPLEMLDLSDLIGVGTNVMNAYLKSGGVKRYLEAILSFLDINNDGDITLEELRNIYDSLIAVRDSKDQESYTNSLKKATLAVVAMLDSDGSGTLDMDDLPKVYDKVAEFAISLATLMVELVKAVVLSITLPALNVAFQLFTEDGRVTKEMVESLFPTSEE
jgi:Ca2+-binding EF-hand superfamily protein